MKKSKAFYINHGIFCLFFCMRIASAVEPEFQEIASLFVPVKCNLTEKKQISFSINDKSMNYSLHSRAKGAILEDCSYGKIQAKEFLVVKYVSGAIEGTNAPKTRERIFEIALIEPDKINTVRSESIEEISEKKFKTNPTGKIAQEVKWGTSSVDQVPMVLFTKIDRNTGKKISKVVAKLKPQSNSQWFVNESEE